MAHRRATATWRLREMEVYNGTILGLLRASAVRIWVRFQLCP